MDMRDSSSFPESFLNKLGSFLPNTVNRLWFQGFFDHLQGVQKKVHMLEGVWKIQALPTVSFHVYVFH